MDELCLLLLLIFVRQALSKHCPQNLYHDDHRGDIRSPEHSGLYPDNTLCTWQINVPPQNSGQIQLLFTSFDLELCSDCSCDYVEVVDVVGQKNVSLGRFCGNQNPGPFYSSGKSLYVVFRSDHGDAKTGFAASYSQVAVGQVCRNFTTLRTAAGNIVSPNWPDKYAVNMDCIWKIVAPAGNRITLKFLRFDVQNCTTQGPCSCDFIEFQDGNSSSAEAMGRFCGSKIPPKLYSSGRYLFVRFKSDGKTGKRGFSAEFDATAINPKDSCPASWRYPLTCGIKECCYDNQPVCCEKGGQRCHGDGKLVRDYCPRPNDDKKRKFCCEERGAPSCCLSQGQVLQASPAAVLVTILISLIQWPASQQLLGSVFGCSWFKI